MSYTNIYPTCVAVFYHVLSGTDRVELGSLGVWLGTGVCVWGGGRGSTCAGAVRHDAG